MIIQCTPAMADALSVIFRKEDIPYTHGIGPGCIAIEVDGKYVKQARAVLEQWNDAVNKLVNEVSRA